MAGIVPDQTAMPVHSSPMRLGRLVHRKYQTTLQLMRNRESICDQLQFFAACDLQLGCWPQLFCVPEVCLAVFLRSAGRKRRQFLSLVRTEQKFNVRQRISFPMEIQIRESAVGWGTLALINAGLAQGRNRSGLGWFIASLFVGPLAILIIVLLEKGTPSDDALDRKKHFNLLDLRQR